ncbi:MAG: DUF1573 domain-containing protein [Candidatus Andersenbacteria bacterium]|nr:DUF1573 domain-containing protein [Candidatus Andersenbacteria bacterium]
MNKTTVVGIAVAVAVLGGMVWAGRPETAGRSSQATVQRGGLTASEAAFDFGSVSMAAGTVRHSFTITNTASEPVSISTVFTSCMCTSATLKVNDQTLGPYGMPGHGPRQKINETIDPREAAAVEVEFDPAAHGPAGVGRIQRTVTIENSAGQPLELGIMALVTP